MSGSGREIAPGVAIVTYNLDEFGYEPDMILPSSPDGAVPRASKNRLVELDALRGLGALAVVLFHLTTRYPEVFPKADHIPVTFWPGEYRVLLFFAISGFAIFFTLKGIGNVADFAVNRIARLFPAYWVAILLILLFEYAGQVDRLKIPLSSLLVNFTMLQGFFYLPSVDGAYWTLTMELAFYACMIGLWLAFGPRMERLEWVLLPWLGLRWLMMLWPDMPFRLILLLVVQFIPFFAIGMLFHRVWSGARRWQDQLPYFAAVLLTLYVTDTFDLFVAGCVLIVLFAAVLGGLLRPFCVPPILWAGEISYSLYLVHENIGFVIMRRAQMAGINHWVGFMMALSTVMVLGWLLNRHVEKPAARWIMQRHARWMRLRCEAGASGSRPGGSGAMAAEAVSERDRR